MADNSLQNQDAEIPRRSPQFVSLNCKKKIYVPIMYDSVMMCHSCFYRESVKTFILPNKLHTLMGYTILYKD